VPFDQAEPGGEPIAVGCKGPQRSFRGGAVISLVRGNSSFLRLFPWSIECGKAPRAGF
jgi:hypothetical protein